MPYDIMTDYDSIWRTQVSHSYLVNKLAHDLAIIDHLVHEFVKRGLAGCVFNTACRSDEIA